MLFRSPPPLTPGDSSTPFVPYCGSVLPSPTAWTRWRSAGPRFTTHGGRKIGRGIEGIVNLDSLRGGSGPLTKRRGVGAGRRGIDHEQSETNDLNKACQTDINNTKPPKETTLVGREKFGSAKWDQPNKRKRREVGLCSLESNER